MNSFSFFDTPSPNDEFLVLSLTSALILWRNHKYMMEYIIELH